MLITRSKNPLISIEDQSEGWAWVNLCSVGKDFIHRWATVKVDLSTGKVLKLEQDRNLEDTWTLEYDPDNPRRH